MRDVRSKNYFEQMKGRGTRVLARDDLQKVTPSATENKDHSVIVDAVGVTKSVKGENRTLERKPSVSLKNLMMNVALGARDEDTLTSLASRIIRLDRQMTASERKAFTETVGILAGKMAAWDLLVETSVNTAGGRRCSVIVFMKGTEPLMFAVGSDVHINNGKW